MIKSVTVINPQKERLTLQMRDPRPTGIAIREISGLGPPQAQINTSKTASRDGVTVESASLAGRNIVLKLGLLPAPTVEEVRLKTYRFFPIKQTVGLEIVTNKRIVRTSGVVETNDPSIFSPDTLSQVSILCEDAYFFDNSEKPTTNVSFFSVTPGFEFPFTNPRGAKTLEFSQIIPQYEKEVTYVGDAETGVRVIMEFQGDVENPVIFKPLALQSLRLDTTYVRRITGQPFIAGDRVEINTNVGNKSAVLYRNGVYINIINALGRRVSWINFQRGVNRLRYDASLGVENLQVQVESPILYEGI